MEINAKTLRQQRDGRVHMHIQGKEEGEGVCLRFAHASFLRRDMNSK